ncbi:hypothetical protein [Oceanispirochaeta sp. M2]|nr:hypothetical protein [Oceanispirochaeta sp. M2]MBF9018352.1 hypothetical protein [Oceanispirochaeta sp. M2]
MKKIVLISLIVSLMSCQTNSEEEHKNEIQFEYEYSDEQFEKLKIDVSEVDKLVNVSARKHADTYFNLGKAYYERNALENSLESLNKGLRLESTNYEYQLLAAIIEYNIKEYDKSYVRLLSIKSSTDQEFIDEVQNLEQKILDTGYIYSGIFIPNRFDKYIYILPIEDIEEIYIQAIKNKLESEYKITVKVLVDILNPTKENLRDNHKKYFDSIVNNYISKNGEEQFNELLSYLNENGFISESDYINERVVHFFYSQEENGDELWKTNMDLIEDQYDADKIMNQINSQYRELINETDCLGILGITTNDIYANTYNFLFGWNSSDIAVMSYNRFIKGETTSEIKIKRANMQALSSAGYLVGIPRCTVAHCSRAYPHSLDEHDNKEEILCDECKSNLKNTYEQMDI